MRNFAVIGLGKFGFTVATTLYENGAEIIAIDNDEKKLEELRGRVSATVRMDCTDEQSLKNIGITDVDVVILAVGEVETSVLSSAILKKLGVINIHAKVDSQLHARILEIIGVKNIHFPEKQIGEQLAHTLLSPNVLNYVNLSSGHCITELAIPDIYVGKTLQQLDLPNKKKIHVVAIKHTELTVSEEGENVVETKVNDLPGANDTVKEGDVLILLGPTSNISALIKEVTPDMGAKL